MLLYGALPLSLAACASTAAPAPMGSVPHSVSDAATPTVVATGAPVGTATAACTTGECEVRVTPPETISFKPGLELTKVQVTGISDGQVTLLTTSTYSGGEADVYAGGAQCSTNSDNEVTTNVLSAGCTATNNRLKMIVVSVDGDSAVLKLAPLS